MITHSFVTGHDPVRYKVLTLLLVLHALHPARMGNDTTYESIHITRPTLQLCSAPSSTQTPTRTTSRSQPQHYTVPHCVRRLRHAPRRIVISRPVLVQVGMGVVGGQYATLVDAEG